MTFPKIPGGAAAGAGKAVGALKTAAVAAAVDVREVPVAPLAELNVVKSGMGEAVPAVSAAVVAREVQAQLAMGALQNEKPLWDIGRQLNNVVQYVTASAAARGLQVAFEVKPEVNAFVSELARGNTNRGYLKSLVDGFLGQRLEAQLSANLKPGQTFEVALNPALTAEQRTAIKTSLNLGATIDSVNAKYSPIVLSGR